MSTPSSLLVLQGEEGKGESEEFRLCHDGMHASAMRQVGESIEGQLMNQIEWDWQQLDCSVLMEQLLDFKMEEICTLVALCCQEVSCHVGLRFFVPRVGYVLF